MPLSLPAATPAVRVDDPTAACAEPLAAFRFDGEAEAIALPLLAGPLHAEVWTGDPRAYRMLQLDVAEQGDIAAAAAAAYRQLLAQVRGSSHPYLLRIWNFFADINLGAGDAERYRHFCVGRAAAVDAQFHAPPPAATAIGADSERRRLQLIALCGAAPGIALENPRQTPAWRYPREFGPVSPGFSRGVVLGADASAVLLASGTASIVGHVSQHLGDCAAQLQESLANLDALLDEGRRRSGAPFALSGCSSLRVYLRDPADLAPAQRIIAGALPAATPVRYLRGDICRRELAVELEGVFLSG